MSALLTQKDIREAEALLDAFDVVADLVEHEKHADILTVRFANVSEFAFTGLVKKFPGLCDNIERSVEDIEAEIKSLEKLRDKWVSAKMQGSRAAIYTTALALVYKIFGDLGKVAIGAALALVSEVAITLFIRALVSMKRAKKRKALQDFDPKMVKACKTAKQQKAKDVEKTLNDIAESEKEASAPSVVELHAQFDTLNILFEALDNEKLAGTEQYDELQEKVAGLSAMAFKAALYKMPGLCNYIGADSDTISKEIKNLDHALKELKKGLVRDNITASIKMLVIGLVFSLFSKHYPALVAALVATVGTGILGGLSGLGYLYMKALSALHHMTLRGMLDEEKKEQLLAICAKKQSMSSDQLRKLLEKEAEKSSREGTQKNSLVDDAISNPVERMSSLTILEADLAEMEIAVDQLHLIAEDLLAPNMKEAGKIREEVIKRFAAQWAKLVVKSPGLCRYLGMTQYGLKRVISRVEKELELVKQHWNGRNAGAAKGAAVAIFARVKGFPPGSEIILQFSLPILEKLVVLYLKGLWLLHKIMSKPALHAIMYESFDLACKTVYPVSTPDEKVILKEEKDYQRKLENGTAAPGLPAAKL